MVWVQTPWAQKQKQWSVAGKNTKVWQRPGKEQPNSVPATFEIDKDVRYTGTVSGFWKFKGYGFIDLDQKGVVPGDKVFVFWKSVQSDDRFPCLVKGQDVEFSLRKWKDNGQTTLRATQVSMVGGATVQIQDEIDAHKKNFVGGQHLRYTGTLKFFNPRTGFGYISIDPGHMLDEEVSSKDLRVETAEVNAGGKQPPAFKDLPVEFGIWQTQKGAYKAYNMTLPGGLPVTQEALENRTPLAGKTYQGQVELWYWKQGHGFIVPAPGTMFPPQVQAKLKKASQMAKQSGKTVQNERMLYFRKADCQEGFKPDKGASVTFQVYMDDKGVGAFEVC